MAGPEEKLRTLQLRILNAVRTKDRHKIFEEPVDGDVVEDYYTIIKHPMCFQAMEQKIGNNEYETMKLFQVCIFFLSRTSARFPCSHNANTLLG